MSRFGPAARRFLIWRAGSAVGWDCTYADLAAAAGVTAETARNICANPVWRRRGWFAQPLDEVQPGFQNTYAVDHLMNLSDGNRLRRIFDS